MLFFYQQWHGEEVLYLPQLGSNLTLFIKRVTLCALNCIKRLFD